MKRLCYIIFFLSSKCISQKVDSIYFNLYTDSLKRGVHNYINIVGRLSNGNYRPLNNKQILFWSSSGTWEGNDLIPDTGFTGQKISVKATLKENPLLFDSITIYLKTVPDTSKLKTEKEIFEKKKD